MCLAVCSKVSILLWGLMTLSCCLVCRFVGVPGLGCFDLDTYLTMAERSRKWQCPHSMRNMSVRELHIDTYVSTLLPFFQVTHCGLPDMLHVLLLAMEPVASAVA